MSRRRISAVLAGAVALGTFSLVPLAGTASAEPTFVPAADDIVGVGSDTTQFALNNLADGATVAGVAVPGYNATHATARLVSFDAFGATLPTTITPKVGAAAIPRPVGSGAGKALLFGAGNVPSINFARSSSSLNAAETAAGLFQVPFALDGLKLAVRAAGSNAPAFISPANMVAIYNGTVTNWNQIGGQPGVIVPLIPQAGSGTLAFFTAQLTAANGGTPVTLAGTVTTTEEHSDLLIKDNPNAVAPFSTGRAKSTPTVALLGGTAAGGFEARRALYNVVRQADLGASWFAPIFGSGGFICSAAARPLIDAAGFDQFALASAGGVCGEPTQAASTNFTLSTPVTAPAPAQATTTTLTGSVSGQTVTLSARVAAAAGTPTGSVTVREGATTVGTANLSGGVGLLALTKVAAGTHTYTASYTPTNAAAFAASQSGATAVRVAAPAVVKKASTTKVTIAKRFSKAKRVTVTIRVTVGRAAAAGKVAVTMGKRTLAKGTIKRGVATLKLPKLKKGTHTLVIRYLGNATTKASLVRKKVTVTA